MKKYINAKSLQDLSIIPQAIMQCREWQRGNPKPNQWVF